MVGGRRESAPGGPKSRTDVRDFGLPAPYLRIMNRVTWPVALIVAALIGAVTIGLALDKPVTDLMALANLVLWAVLYGELREVKTQTNGQTHRLMSLVEKTTTGAPVQPAESEHPKG